MTPSNDPNRSLPAAEAGTTAFTPPSPPAEPLAVAPAWHTVLLVVGIVGVSLYQAMQFGAPHAAPNRLATYALTATMELAVLAWIALGLRIRRVRFRSLLGDFSFSLRSMAVDCAWAALFWFGAILVLGSCALAWSGVEAVATHRLPAIAAGQPLAPNPAQQQTLRTLKELAPSNQAEAGAWILLCLLAGFAEEVAFRGYLQRQFVAAARGRTAPGVLLAALCFGAAHGYEGARGMFLISVFGALFSLLALYRRSLRPGMIAHAWQDLLAGFAIAFLKANHFI